MGIFHGKKDGLKLTAYTGDRAILLAFDLDEEQIDRLAGFTIAATPPDIAGSIPQTLSAQLKFLKNIVYLKCPNPRFHLL